MSIIKRNEKGEKLTLIARSLGLAASTVGTIAKNADSIRKTAQTATPGCSFRITKGRDSSMERMESLLYLWIEDQNQRNVPPILLANPGESQVPMGRFEAT